VLETAGLEPDAALIDGWRSRAARARARLGWAAPGVVARRHAGGVSLALAAPPDQLFTATEVNEWAWCATLLAREPARWSGLERALAAAAGESAAGAAPDTPPVLEEAAALERLTLLAAREARPDLMRLLAGAAAHSLPYVLDETLLTLGAGALGRDFELASLPEVAAVPWSTLGDIPTAVVTGSNGKTTSVRLLAACAEAHGWSCAYCCTDGVFLGGTSLAGGDYAGPLGARLVMRERRARCAIVEAARGGILRRGIALSRAHVALVTNVSPDHFGEYGIDDLDGLADVKLSVAGLVGPGGLLVLNADDERLVAKVPQLGRRFRPAPPIGWFSRDDARALATAQRAGGGPACGVRAGRLLLHHRGAQHDLGSVSDMPLTVGGSAGYNVANLAGAALAAAALGVPPAVIADVCARFGSSAADNFGRLMRFEHAGVRVLLDYAHNVEGLRGLLEVAEHLRAGAGRLGTLLGHAGNRQDAEIEALARVAAGFHPALVVVKENEAHLRGRAPGEIPRIIHAALVEAGIPAAALAVRMSELEAVRCALEWARPGDVLALPVHSTAARAAVLEMLESWRNP
jgi:UDP-N-acetylmuramyl tripeptide synthase